MIKEHIDTKTIRRLAVDILDNMDSIEEFGHVGNYAITKEDTVEISEKVQALLNQSIELIEGLQEKIKESYEY